MSWHRDELARLQLFLRTIYVRMDWDSALRHHAILVLLALVSVGGQRSIASEERAPLSVSWRLIDNLDAGSYVAELSLKNETDMPLDSIWRLYFNSSAKLSLADSPTDFKLTHINGDFFVLRPSDGSKTLPANVVTKIRLRGEPWAINISDAPSGFYLLRSPADNSPNLAVPLPLRILPFPSAEKLHRGGDDRVQVVTAESRYLQNKSLKELPSEEVGKVTPTPVATAFVAGKFHLSGQTKIVYEPAAAVEAQYLAQSLGVLLSKSPGLDPLPSNTQTDGNAISLRIANVKVAGAEKKQGDEAYQLTIDGERGIEIVGTDPAGVFYGIQTLRALMPSESYKKRSDSIAIGAAKIADAPRFQYRGLHLDVARNFHDTASVEKLVELMSFYKLNRLHLHLTDDEGWRLEIKQLPELTEVGGRRGHTLDEADCLIPSLGSGPVADAKSSAGSGFYSQEEFVELLRYAQARHVSIIPEIDLPGHARAAVKSMEARQCRLKAAQSAGSEQFLLTEPGDASKYESVQMWHDNVIDVGHDETYKFIDVVVGEIQEMYRRARVPLMTVHLGGDEVPNGVWEKSRACDRLVPKDSSSAARKNQLELYFLNRASQLLSARSIQTACWEDCLLLEADKDNGAAEKRRSAKQPVPTAYVWNNVWGWGREDAAYRLANAGFDVVLCNATNLYFDLACEKDPLERGYYWAGFVGTRAPFDFVPLDVFKNASRTSMGVPLQGETFADRVRLTPAGKSHILGIQGELWSENLRDSRRLEYMAFPRVIGLAERAWAESPKWATIESATDRAAACNSSWNEFANRLGQRELPRLDYLCGGVRYRLPPPGVASRDGTRTANVDFPGLTIRYTVDGSEPDDSSKHYDGPISVPGTVKARSFDSHGRGSRTSESTLSNRIAH